MDDIDRAQEREEKGRALCLAQRRPVLPPCGICYNCTEPVSGVAEFCNAECREDYEQRESALKRAGR